jgi:starch phosphorylase
MPASASASPRSSAHNKERARGLMRAAHWASRLDPDALFDVQIKRIHEYKRQLLNVLRGGRALRRDPRAIRERDWVPRVEDLRRQGGRRAIACAKLIIKLINDVARRRQQRSRRAAACSRSCSCRNYNVSAWPS